MSDATATFAAGCFWGVEADFRDIPGVLDVEAGYTGGRTVSPTYQEVCSGTTGHAEAVRVRFDPEAVSYERLLETFFAVHDATQVNRQGPDVGTQYRTAIFVHDAQQRAAAERAKHGAQASSPRPIATEIVDAGPFYPAEDYHQNYLQKRGMRTCRI